MKSFFVAVFVAVIVPTIGSAQVDYLECAKVGGRSTWIPDQFVIARDGASSEVTN